MDTVTMITRPTERNTGRRAKHNKNRGNELVGATKAYELRVDDVEEVKARECWGTSPNPSCSIDGNICLVLLGICGAYPDTLLTVLGGAYTYNHN
jgi:hypothetical protein